MSNTIKMTGYELLGNSVIKVELFGKNIRQPIIKEFKGDNIKDLTRQAFGYINKLRKKYPGIKIDTTKMPKASVAYSLIKLANKLDKVGEFGLASEIDSILYEIVK